MTSDLESTLAYQLNAVGIPFEQQVKAIPGRKFAFDFAITGTSLLLEVNGGTWVANTGHTSGKGIRRDVTKQNLAVLNGYRLLSFTADMVNSGEALAVIEKAIEEEKMSGKCPICKRVIDPKEAEKHAKYHVNRLEVGQKTTIRMIIQIITGEEK